ncbi:prepilin-type N-terminal cleavage/methylation domain-containing protein [Aliivibrio salmonicida]|jgi:MSHA pilin protein MshB|uniref:Type IV pilus, prepilin-like protein (MSHB) n=2 Tax=Aliivibrio salmonicida TaxID=40269 RepID=B6EM79_ALISL|nr:prepilin-type N-terminal cleavage/methylation domain-containing protein [Aliivibrio salmonicida]CAQ78160.1 type IV pilus, prepilin-like protein (MSHB) [Aliivibrio salmonicida LFI1238]
MIMKRQKGFSLVELVIVIVVIGLLATVALPRFLDVSLEAKKASVEGVAGGYATAVLSARAQWEAEARPKIDGYNAVSYDGTEFWLTDPSQANQSDFRPGYPMAPREDLDGATTGGYPSELTSKECILLMEMLLQNAPYVTDDAKDEKAKYLAEIITDNSRKQCKYTQQENEGHFFTYEPESGRVVVTLQ